MRLAALSVLLVVCVVVGEWSSVECKKSSSRSSVSSRPRSSGGGGKKSSKAAAAAGRSKRRSVVEEEDEDDLAGPSFLDEDDEDDEEEPEPEPRRRASSSGKKSASRRAPPAKRSGGATKRSPPRRDRKGRGRSSRDVEEEEEYDEENYDDDYDEEDAYDDYRPRRRSSSSRGGRVVPYSSRNHHNQKRRRPPSTFTRGLAALRENMPDPNAVASATLGSLRAARDTASSLSTKVVREVKGLTSSELEQVMLKATRPDDAPVKGKHVERLVGVTYQISGKYDIYDAVLRKLWNKLTEPDARTKMKALYVLHRFSSDGAPDHRAALKARLRELRRTRDPKSKTKERYFNSKRLTVDEEEQDHEHETGDDKEKARRYAAYLERYGRYVLLRAQCFGGPFVEIADPPSPPPSRKGAKSKKNHHVPLTSSRLRADHLEGAAMVLEASRACALKDGECVEHTASAAERVAADLLGLTAATAAALDRALSKDDHENKALLKRWCVFYREDLLPKTKALVRKVSPKLDRYGLFLPSRLAANVRPELLDKGLRYDDDEMEEENDNKKKDNAEEETKDEVADEADTISSSQKVSASSTQDDEEDEVEDDDDDEEEEDEDEDDEEEDDVPAKSAPSKSKESAYEDEDDEEEDGYDYEEVEEYYDEE